MLTDAELMKRTDSALKACGELRDAVKSDEIEVVRLALVVAISVLETTITLATKAILGKRAGESTGTQENAKECP